ncbi:hypothetical protein ACJMK2_016820 [Sinanodonta woodiana]|uniref:Uncharacterized protein n=1 Tax=Sinanodonta woodiana TaxID=1069815 RepID=A0ABD3UUY4_SINWO
MALHRTPTTSRLQSELALHLPLEEGGKRASKMKRDREGVFTRLYSRSDGSLDRTARSSRYFASPTSSGDDVSLPSIRSGTGASTYRGGRKKQLDLPSEFRTPGPGDYRIASTIGKTPGASFKGNRERNFGNAKSSNAVFLLPRLVNDTPSPGQYDVRSDIGSGLKSTFPRSKRDSRFIGDKNSNAGFIVNRAIDANPAPNRYKQRSTIGADPSDPVSPRSNALSFSRAQRESNFPGALNARFLLPKVIPKYPAPTSYQSGASSFANSYLTRGSTFSHARRNARFSGDYRAKFLLLS